MAVNVKTSSNTINVKVGQADAIKVLSSAAGASGGTSDTAKNVIGGIGSITALDVSGITTLGITSVTDTLYVAGITTVAANGGITTTGGDFYTGGNLFIGGALSTNDLNVSGIATFGSTSVVIDGDNDLINVGTALTLGSGEGVLTPSLVVSGVSTLGVTSATNLTAQQLNVSGVGSATFSNNSYFQATSLFTSPVDLDAKVTISAILDAAASTFNNVRAGWSGDGEIDTSSGNLTLDSAGGTVIVDDALTVVGNTGIGSLNVSGVSTFSDDVSLTDNTVLQFGASKDLKIYHTTASGGYSAIVDEGTGQLAIGGNIIEVKNAALNQTYATIDGSGIDVIGHTETDTLNVSGVSTFGGRIVGAATSNVIPFLYSNFSDLPSASTYHGAFAHVHARGKGYFAHASNWYELVNTQLNGTVGTGTERYNIGPTNVTTLNASGISTFGDYVGLSTGLTVAGVSTFAGIVTTSSDLYVGGDLYVQDDLVLDEITSRHLNITGLSTFVGNAQFDSNVTIGGTLTYEDVTNVDSIGIITAGKGLRATAGGLVVTAGVSTFGGATFGGQIVGTSATFTSNAFIDGTLTAGLIDGGSY